MSNKHLFLKNDCILARPKMSKKIPNLGCWILGIASVAGIGYILWSEKKMEILQKQFAQIGAYNVRIDGQDGPHTQTALVQVQSYCMDTPPGELGKYTQSVKDQLSTMIANGKSISQCPNYPKEIPYVSYQDKDDQYRNNILKKNVIENIQKDLTYLHGFKGLVDGWAGEKTNTGVATFQYHCLPAESYTLGKIDEYTIEQIHAYVQAGKRVSSCKNTDL